MKAVERVHVRDKARDILHRHGGRHHAFECDECLLAQAVIAFTPPAASAPPSPECGVEVLATTTTPRRDYVEIRTADGRAGHARRRMTVSDALRVGTALVIAAVEAGAEVSRS